MIVGDYGKGVVTQPLLEELEAALPREWRLAQPGSETGPSSQPCRSVAHYTQSQGSIRTGEIRRRHEKPESPCRRNSCSNRRKIAQRTRPALLLITLGELGMLLCQRGQKPSTFPTVAQEVFDVSGAGDTVIATFTLAIAAGASPVEAAILSNHAAGIVVGKIGTATTTPRRIAREFQTMSGTKVTADSSRAMKARGRKDRRAHRVRFSHDAFAG